MKETRITKYIKSLIRNHKYLTTEDIMLTLQKYYNLPINVPSVYYKYKKIIRECRQEVYRERRRQRRKGKD
jgi:Cdc6-like AAA superfamily ATPase